MSFTTKIEWADHTFNPWEGCTKVSPGCAHCYAEARNARFGGGSAPNWGPGAPRRRTSVANWYQPLRWDRIALSDRLRWAEKGDPAPPRPRVFCASLADWLDDEVPVEWLADLLALIRATPNLDWLLLTKRPQNWRERILLARNHLTLPDGDTAVWLNDWLPKEESAGRPKGDGNAPANVWLGASVENQARADERIPLLLAIPARVRFLSCEPLLGPLNLREVAVGAERVPYDPLRGMELPGPFCRDRIHWVICGGESGAKARPMHPEWARGLRDNCSAAGVPFFFKQWGEWLPFDQCNGAGIKMPMVAAMNHAHTGAPVRVGKKKSGRLLDGVEHNAFPVSQPSALSSPLPP